MKEGNVLNIDGIDTFTHIDLNVEITHLPDLNINVETSLTNQSIVDLEESYENNLEESNNGADTIFITLCMFTLSLIITRNYCIKCVIILM
jgi:hypothetical protein